MSTITITETKLNSENTMTMKLTRPALGEHWKEQEEFALHSGLELLKGVDAQRYLRAPKRILAAYEAMLRDSPTVYTLVSRSLRTPRGITTEDQYYFAMPGEYPASSPPSPSLKPQYVLRLIHPKVAVDASGRPVPIETFEDILYRMEKEIDVTRLIRDLSLGSKGQNACMTDYICIVDTFVTRRAVIVAEQRLVVDVVVEVYPFFESMTLREFAEKIFFKTFADSPHNYRVQVCTIAEQLLQVIGTLNAFGLYHRNINPDSILISYELKQINVGGGVKKTLPVVKSLRLSNFEYSCSFLTNEMARYVLVSKYVGSYDADRSCAVVGSNGWDIAYKSPAIESQVEFTDPLASVENRGKFSAADETQLAQRRHLVNRNWPRIELFSIATVVQWLVTNPADFQAGVPIRIRKTERSFDDLQYLLEEMANRELLVREQTITYVPRIKVVKTTLEVESLTTQ